MSYRVPVDTLSAVAETWQDRRLYLIGGAALAIHGVTRRDTDDSIWRWMSRSRR